MIGHLLNFVGEVCELLRFFAIQCYTNKTVCKVIIKFISHNFKTLNGLKLREREREREREIVWKKKW